MPVNQRNSFFKSHSLGNDYVVLDPAILDFRLTSGAIRLICDRNTGIGGDGVVALRQSTKADFGVSIYNSDGSEAETSGNGLRIFGLYALDTRMTTKHDFNVESKAGVSRVRMGVDRVGDVFSASVTMGKASFRPADIPCTLDVPELMAQKIVVRTRALRFTGVSVGNPHCVIFSDCGYEWTRDDLLRLGPELELHRIFPRRANVQLASAVSQTAIRIMIWERGSGETSASGSSSCAAASVGVRLGLVKSPVEVNAPGGSVSVEVDPEFNLSLSGPVSSVYEGSLSSSMVKNVSLQE